MSAMPHPPFPNPDSEILKLIVNNAIAAMHEAFHSLMSQAGMQHDEEGTEGMHHEGMQH